MNQKQTFHPLIDAEITADEMEVYEEDGTYGVVVPFADDNDETHFASVECRASPTEFEGRDFYEFSFFISITPTNDDAEDDEILDLWTSEAARPCIPEEIRHLILPMVMEAYKKLAEHLDKPSIYRVTYGSNPSDETLAKHELITKCLQDAGYEIEDCGTDESGRAFWMMTPQV